MHLGGIFDLRCFVVIKICYNSHVFFRQIWAPKFQSSQKNVFFPSLLKGGCFVCPGHPQLKDKFLIHKTYLSCSFVYFIGPCPLDWRTTLHYKVVRMGFQQCWHKWYYWKLPGKTFSCSVVFPFREYVLIIGWFHIKTPRKIWQFFFRFLTKKIKSFWYFSNKKRFFNKNFVIFDHF